MTVIELLEACHRKIVSDEQWQWPCFGPDTRLLLIGSPDLHQASAVVDQETLRVYALELPLRAQWVDPEYRTAYQDQLSLEGLTPPTDYLSEPAILKLLAEITE
jgi:hypothetical protein